MLELPLPDRLPADWAALRRAVRGSDLSVTAPARRLADTAPAGHPDIGRLGAPGPAAEAEQAEHDNYFAVTRTDGTFVSGLVDAYTATYINCATMGVSLVDEVEWAQLFEGWTALVAIARAESVTREVAVSPPSWPGPSGWRSGYDPARRWLVGHQLFFALIQGAIVGLNCFAASDSDASGGAALSAESIEDADAGLFLAAAFLRSSAAAMRFTSDFTPHDYETAVRPAMSPPTVRAGFSGLQTRDHAYLVRLFGALKPMLTSRGRSVAHEEFVESVVTAYAAHEFICARFRGDVLPSLRMAAHTRGKTERSGVEVIRDMMRSRLALIDVGQSRG